MCFWTVIRLPKIIPVPKSTFRSILFYKTESSSFLSGWTNSSLLRVKEHNQDTENSFGYHQRYAALKVHIHKKRWKIWYSWMPKNLVFEKLTNCQAFARWPLNSISSTLKVFQVLKMHGHLRRKTMPLTTFLSDNWVIR